MLTIARAEMKNFWNAFPPSNLIDGDLDSFAHTFEVDDGMWMRVYLETESSVTKVIVYNRIDFPDRIVGASVFIKKGKEYVKDFGKINNAENSYTFSCEGDGNVIEISQEGTVGYWNIAEIQVYSTPANIPCPGF